MEAKKSVELGPLHKYEKLMILRRRLKIPQEQLASALNVRQEYISRLESGKNLRDSELLDRCLRYLAQIYEDSQHKE